MDAETSCIIVARITDGYTMKELADYPHIHTLAVGRVPFGEKRATLLILP